MTHSFPSLAVFGSLALASVLMFLIPQPPGPDLRLSSRTLEVSHDEFAALHSDIKAADLVLVLDISGRNASLTKELRVRFAYHHICKLTDCTAMAVVLRHPLVDDPKRSDSRTRAAGSRVDPGWRTGRTASGV